ncbi:hypothetical protein ACQ4PT_041329 [Festuca glaucescens]
MDMILQTVDERISHHEKKIGRQLMEIEHKLDAKLITINEELIDIKRTNGAQPRLSKAEDELRDVKKELEGMKFLIRTNTQSSMSKDTYVQEKVNRGEYDLRPDPRAHASTAMFGDTTARTPSAKHVVQNKECDKRKQPRKPIFDDDYRLTDEDTEVVLFIRESYDRAQVADIGGFLLTAAMLKPCVNKGFFYDQVHVPLNVHKVSWLLLVFNFDKEELQVLNSSQSYRDQQAEKDLVGLHSCGEYMLKYMLSWDGNEMTEYFVQALIDIFSYKICSRLLRSDCNPLRKDSYMKPITEEDYDASNPKDCNGAEDDIREISDPNVAEKPKEDVFMETSPTKPRRKRGRPRKVKTDTPTDTVEQEIATETTDGLADGKHIRKPSTIKKSPYKTP